MSDLFIVRIVLLSYVGLLSYVVSGLARIEQLVATLNR